MYLIFGRGLDRVRSHLTGTSGKLGSCPRRQISSSCWRIMSSYWEIKTRLPLILFAYVHAELVLLHDTRKQSIKDHLRAIIIAAPVHVKGNNWHSTVSWLKILSVVYVSVIQLNRKLTLHLDSRRVRIHCRHTGCDTRDQSHPYHTPVPGRLHTSQIATSSEFQLLFGILFTSRSLNSTQKVQFDTPLKTMWNQTQTALIWINNSNSNG